MYTMQYDGRQYTITDINGGHYVHYCFITTSRSSLVLKLLDRYIVQGIFVMASFKGKTAAQMWRFPRYRLYQAVSHDPHEKFHGMILCDSYDLYCSANQQSHSYMAFVLELIWRFLGYRMVAVCLEGAMASDYQDMFQQVHRGYLRRDWFSIIIYSGNDFYMQYATSPLITRVRKDLQRCITNMRLWTQGGMLISCHTTSEIWRYHHQWRQVSEWSYGVNQNHFFASDFDLCNLLLQQTLQQALHADGIGSVLFAVPDDYTGFVPGDLIGHAAEHILPFIYQQWCDWVMNICTYPHEPNYGAIIIPSRL